MDMGRSFAGKTPVAWLNLGSRIRNKVVTTGILFRDDVQVISRNKNTLAHIALMC